MLVFSVGGDQNKVNWSGYDFDDFDDFASFNLNLYSFDVLWKYVDPETQNPYLKSSTCQ